MSVRLTVYTDYALRTLISLAIARQETLSLADIAEQYGISRNHLAKVAQQLSALGHIETVRGRGGGMKLARRPGEINIGALVRACEPDTSLADCANCIIAPDCALTCILSEALDAFYKILDKYSLQDLVQNDAQLAKLLMPYEKLQ